MPMITLSKEARLLLLWLVARWRNVVAHQSASHEDVLLFIPDLSKAHAELRQHGMVTADDVSYGHTEAGRRYLVGDPNWASARERPVDVQTSRSMGQK